MNILACDVSKDVVTPYSGVLLKDVENSKKALRELLAAHPGYVVVCEATSSYHLELVELAHRLKHPVYVVNPKEARNFKDSLSFRAKTDALDARYLFEYAARNMDLLRLWAPLPKELRELKKLIGERSVVVESKARMALSFGKRKCSELDAAFKAMNELIAILETRMLKISQSFECFERMQSIPGVGPIIASALVFLLESRDYDDVDALVAFVGLDVRVRQSGKFKGRRKLTKRGDSTLRYLLCVAGRCLLTSKVGRPKKAQLIAQGRHLPERMAIAGRKVLRTAWSLYNTKQSFDPQKWKWGLT